MKELAHNEPSLFVKIIDNDLVLACYGRSIRLYNYRTSELINECPVFQKNKVHGLDLQNGMLLAYGGTSLSVFELKELMEGRPLLELEKRSNDWIVSCAFDSKGSQIYILTCYNQVTVIELSGKVVSRHSLNEERSILYCGSVKVIEGGDVLINAGTVMSGIISWSLGDNRDVAELYGHEGSIFYVTCSNDGKLVASCSDDRSIRLWDRESRKELAIGWGHTARIWQLKFISKDSKLISVSEDCTLRIWDIIESKDGRFMLTQVHSFELHLNKSIWSVDVDEHDMISITSGNDGRIRSTDLKPKDRYSTNFVSMALMDQKDGFFMDGEIVKGFHMFQFGLIGITSLGNVFAMNPMNGALKIILCNKKFQSFSITHGISDHNIIIFMNNYCDVLFIKLNDTGDEIMQMVEFQLNSLSKTSNCTMSMYDNNHFSILVESPNMTEPLLLLTFDCYSLVEYQTRRFRKPKNFVSSCHEFIANLLIVGSRYGYLAAFKISEEDKNPYLIKLSNGDTTTSIKSLRSENNSLLLLVTNRDGFYNIIEWNTDSCKFKILHANRIAKGFLEGAFFDSNDDLVIYGFKSNIFFVHNETKNYEIASEVCGGAHRQWKLNFVGDSVVLTYIKASRIYMRKINKGVVPAILCDGIHGKEIRDIAIQPVRKYGRGFLFCTGSEDTTIKLNHFNEETRTFKTYWTIRKHVSGIQRCKFLSDQYLVSSSAREELYLWEIDHESEIMPFIKCVAQLPTSTDIPDLRIMDFDHMFLDDQDPSFILSTVYSDSTIKVWYYNSDKSKFQLLLSGRYKTCCILNVRFMVVRNEIHLMVASTDGYITIYNISENLPLRISSGKIKYDFEKAFDHSFPHESFTIQLHQSGIKGLDWCRKSETGIVDIFTGGDDNALHAMKFERVNNKWKILNHIKIEHAATSTITSVKLANHDEVIITTSVDQIVRKRNANDLQIIEQAYTTVADTGSLALRSCQNANEGILLVGGVGISAWSF